MDKQFTVISKDGKWFVMEYLKPLNPLKRNFDSKEDEDFYNDKLENAENNALPTLPQDAQFWAALENKVFGEDVFEVKQMQHFPKSDDTEEFYMGLPDVFENITPATLQVNIINFAFPKQKQGFFVDINRGEKTYLNGELQHKQEDLWNEMRNLLFKELNLDAITCKKVQVFMRLNYNVKKK